MAVSLRRMLMVLLCVGIALGAADAQGLICEYICAAGPAHFHGHEAEAESTSHRVATGEHHEHSLADASLLATQSSHDDSNCASINKLVIATSDTQTSTGSHAQTVIVIEPVVRTMSADPYLAARINGSPPYRATAISSLTSVSLRI